MDSGGENWQNGQRRRPNRRAVRPWGLATINLVGTQAQNRAICERSGAVLARSRLSAQAFGSSTNANGRIPALYFWKSDYWCWARPILDS